MSETKDSELFHWQQKVWTVAYVRSRPKQCHHCGASIRPGSRAFRPITNGKHRTQRLCPRCMNALGSPAVSFNTPPSR